MIITVQQVEIGNTRLIVFKIVSCGYTNIIFSMTMTMIFLHRHCSLPLVCGNTVIHEDAFCFHRGSWCEQVYENSKRSENPKTPQSNNISNSAIAFKLVV